MRRLVVTFLIVHAAAAAVAGPPRAIVRGDAPPSGVTVLDRRGDLWLVTGDEETLAKLPDARLLADAPARPAAPARDFIPAPTPVIDELVAQVHPADLMAQVTWLVDLGVRYSFAENILAVADSLEAELASYGLQTEQVGFHHGSLPVTNVVATRTGRTRPDSTFVFCAHYDAVSENPYFNTPGADDNGSGVVAVLTIARLLAQVAVDYSVQFVLFAGEEQGLIGSEAWVAAQAAANAPIVGALNFDMLAWWTPGAPYDLEIETDTASLWLADAVVWAAETFTTTPYELHVVDDAWWGDFYSFWRFGYPAVNHEESIDWDDPDFNIYYHTGYDLPETLDAQFFTDNVKVAVAAAAALVGVANLSDVPGAPPSATLAAAPNPFNGRLALRLEGAPADGPTPVAVYDLRGRRLAEVVVPVAGGRGRAVWDARDRDGRPLPGGVYLARAEELPGRPTCRAVYLP